jgi:hypothetical protein
LRCSEATMSAITAVSVAGEIAMPPGIGPK